MEVTASGVKLYNNKLCMQTRQSCNEHTRVYRGLQPCSLLKSLYEQDGVTLLLFGHCQTIPPMKHAGKIHRLTCDCTKRKLLQGNISQNLCNEFLC